MSQFKVIAPFDPAGDQPEAIEKLAKGILSGERYQTLMGVTGSGKTFTMAKVIEAVQRPTLILAHNKTLAAQLYNEFKEFFPHNAVEYFVSYYDYYQPEAYLPVTGKYIEKDLSINEEIERYRLSATSTLLSGRRDVIVVASVSCIYGIGNPAEFKKNTVAVDLKMSRNTLLSGLVQALYSRSETPKAGTFIVKGDTVTVYTPYANRYYKFHFWGNDMESIEVRDVETGKLIETVDKLLIYPANVFVTSRDRIENAVVEIRKDLEAQVEFFLEQGKTLEAKRIRERTELDLEMLQELGYCSGIENYSRYLDGRAPGSRPFCLLDYFPGDYLMFIDESHVTVPQVRAMYGGDRSRKVTLVEHGFRLPSALDNRPLTFSEFEQLQNQVVFVSATPSDYELNKSGGVVVEQIVRPTGLLDPEIEVRPTYNQIDDLLEEIRVRVENDERVLVTTLTKRMAEELTKYLEKIDVRARYIHSDVDTLERVEIMRDLRKGLFDVLVGVNLLREGLDLPEVSLVAILDADKEGFLRSEKALVQVAGRAARNSEGKVIMYADKITDSMQKVIDETSRRREIQMKYNEEHGITPQTVIKNRKSMMADETKEKEYATNDNFDIAADPVIPYMNKKAMEKAMEKLKDDMNKAAQELDFILAAKLRDELFALQKKYKSLFGELPK
jgi:excinuclease ABC subunit B